MTTMTTKTTMTNNYNDYGDSNIDLDKERFSEIVT